MHMLFTCSDTCVRTHTWVDADCTLTPLLTNYGGTEVAILHREATASETGLVVYCLRIKGLELSP